MPLYNQLTEKQWLGKATIFENNYSPCNLCPRRCQAERKEDKRGLCGNGGKVKIASYNLHFGEEPPISGKNGSGTIFFSGCPLKCSFCQNYPISHLSNGKFYTIPQLAGLFLNLQSRGAHNINFVSPTPYLYHIIRALGIASKNGLKIPTVYNTSGYERPEIIKELINVIDIFMPDLKYREDRIALRFSGDRYFSYAIASIKEMIRQSGALQVDKQGIAVKGVIIRHLILPGFINNSKQILKIIANGSLKMASLSLLGQYFPAFNALNDATINRRLMPEEYDEVKNYALSLGFNEGWFQDLIHG